MDKRERARAAVESFPLSESQKELALAGVDRMSEEELDKVLADYARMLKLLDRLTDKGMLSA